MLPMGVDTHIRTAQRRRVSTVVSSWTNFTPMALQPYFWFDAADTSTITSSSGAVSQWNDKSNVGNNLTQGTAANQPITGTNTLNGLNVINFNGSTHGMQTGSFSPPLWQHIFAVVRPTSFPNSYNAVVSQENLTDGYTLLVKSNGKLAIYISRSGNNTNYDGTGNSTLSANTAYSLEYSWNGFQLFGWVNRTSDATVTKTMTMGTAASALNVGVSFFTPRNFAADFAEIIGYPRALLQPESEAVRRYLNAKWGKP